MSKTDRNSGQQWTDGDIEKLEQLLNGNTPTRLIGLKLGRTPGAVYQKASELGLSTKPTNQAPDKRRKPR